MSIRLATLGMARKNDRFSGVMPGGEVPGKWPGPGASMVG